MGYPYFTKGTMKRAIMYISALAILTITIIWIVAYTGTGDYTNKPREPPLSEPIVDGNHAGWRCIEALEYSYSSNLSHIRELSGVSAFVHYDVYWPYDRVNNILCELAKREDLVVVVGKVTSIHSIEVTESTRINGEVIVKYNVRIESSP